MAGRGGRRGAERGERCARTGSPGRPSEEAARPLGSAAGPAPSGQAGRRGRGRGRGRGERRAETAPFPPLPARAAPGLPPRNQTWRLGQWASEAGAGGQWRAGG